MKFETKFISPHMAEALLATNPINRSANLERVLFYESEMNAGKWTMNGQGIIVSTTGKLIDGQKRLFAIIRHGKPVEMLIISNVSEEAFKTIDSGQPRSVADSLGIMGIPYPNIVAAGAGMIWRNVVEAEYNTKCSTPYVVQIWKRFPAIHKWIGHVGSSMKCPLPTMQLLAAITYLEDIARQPELAEDFFAGIVKGNDLKSGDPRLALRNRMFTHKAARGSMAATTTWTATVQAIDALEEDKSLATVSISKAAGGWVHTPRLLKEHLKSLPPAMLLHDLPFLPRANQREQSEFKEYVKQVRGTHEVRPSVNT